MKPDPTADRIKASVAAHPPRRRATIEPGLMVRDEIAKLIASMREAGLEPDEVQAGYATGQTPEWMLAEAKRLEDHAAHDVVTAVYLRDLAEGKTPEPQR